jgi:sugar O-acyltransferase (sialic acid O-acetyltransferase NeuD family)
MTKHASPATHEGPSSPAPPLGLPPLVLIGGGGHALVVLEAALLAEILVAGYLDDNPAAPISAILIDLPHPFPTPPNLGSIGDLQPLSQRHWIISVGDLTHRRRLITKLATETGHARHPEASRGPRSVIHPTAFVSPSALVGPGVYVGPGAVIHSRARVGAHAIINSGAVVEHDCTIEENAHIGPGTVLGGSVTIGRDTLLGLGSRVLPGVRVGAACVVGAGSVVLENVDDHRKLAGVPAKPL